MERSFGQKSVLVTGGGSGIGRAAAHRFAAAGASVLVVDLDVARASSVAEEIRSAGGRADPMGVDVSDEDQVEAAVVSAVDRFGGLDCAFNNAGVSLPRSDFADLTTADWRRLIDVNLTSVFFCMRAQLRHMARRGYGAIVNTASTGGLRPPPRVAPYAAAKHGVIGLTKSAAGEYVGTRIRINALCPGGTDTPLLRASIGIDPTVESRWADRPISSAEDVAAVAVWLCSEEAASVSGVSLVVDGGSMFG